MPEAYISHTSGTPEIQEKARKPRKRPASELAHEVREHHDDEGVGGIAVQAAQHAAEPPLQLADRVVGARHAGVEADVEVDAARGEQPEEEESQGAEVAQHVSRGTGSRPARRRSR